MGSLKAEYGKNSFAKKNYFSQKDGDVVYRIIPAQSQFTNNGRDWLKYHSVVFGYKNTEGKVRPFESVQVKRDGVVTVEDPAVKRIEDLKQKLAKAKEEKNDSLVAKLNTLVGFGGTYSVDNNYHMNVIDLQGNIGVLKIRKSAKDLLDIEIKKLEDDGVDPLSDDNGRFFIFTRNGTGNATSFKVSVYKEKLDIPNVGIVERDMVHKITPEIQAKIDREAQDLNEIATKVTPEEVARIVASADIATGKSPVCNEIFDDRWKAKRDARATNRPEGAPAPQAQAPTPQAAAPAPAQTAPAAQAALQATTAALTAPAPTAVTQSAPTAAALTTPTAAGEQSHEDWLKEIGMDPNS